METAAMETSDGFVGCHENAAPGQEGLCTTQVLQVNVFKFGNVDNRGKNKAYLSPICTLHLHGGPCVLHSKQTPQVACWFF
jgi:hypothetical protein